MSFKANTMWKSQRYIVRVENFLTTFLFAAFFLKTTKTDKTKNTLKLGWEKFIGECPAPNKYSKNKLIQYTANARAGLKNNDTYADQNHHYFTFLGHNTLKSVTNMIEIRYAKYTVPSILKVKV